MSYPGVAPMSRMVWAVGISHVAMVSVRIDHDHQRKIPTSIEYAIAIEIVDDLNVRIIAPHRDHPDCR